MSSLSAHTIDIMSASLEKAAPMVCLDETTAVLVIDTQRHFVSSYERGDSETENIAARIGDTIPSLRDAGARIFAVKTDAPYIAGSSGRYEGFSPSAGDAEITKTEDSAFHKTLLGDELRKAGIKNVLVCGFNFSACVLATAQDAIKDGFGVKVLADLSANDVLAKRANFDGILDYFKAMGAELCTASDILPSLPSDTMDAHTDRLKKSGWTKPTIYDMGR